MVVRRDMTSDEWKWLVRLCQHEADSIPKAIEARLTEIWMQLLGLEQIGIFDNFFDLGGHSLLATKVVSRVRETFEVELPLRAVFESPTIAELSEGIENADRADQEDLEDLSELLESLERLTEAETSALLKEKLETDATTTV